MTPFYWFVNEMATAPKLPMLMHPPIKLNSFGRISWFWHDTIYIYVTDWMCFGAHYGGGVI